MEIAAVFVVACRCLEFTLAMGSESRTIPDWPFLALVLVPFLLLLLVRARKEKDAKKAYYDSLEKLRRDPADRALQAKTARLAKRYVASAQDPRGNSDADELTILDELFHALSPATKSETRGATPKRIEAWSSESEGQTGEYPPAFPGQAAPVG